MISLGKGILLITLIQRGEPFNAKMYLKIFVVVVPKEGLDLSIPEGVCPSLFCYDYNEDL